MIDFFVFFGGEFDAVGVAFSAGGEEPGGVTGGGVPGFGMGHAGVHESGDLGEDERRGDGAAFVVFRLPELGAELVETEPLEEEGGLGLEVGA